MLEQKDEKQVLAHLETLENAYDCYFAAVELHAAFPGKHRAVIAELLRKAMMGAHGVSLKFIMAHQGSWLRSEVIRLAIATLDDAGVKALLRAYDEKNNALRLHFYETLEAEWKDRAVPYLVTGLTRSLGAARSGFVTPAKYATRLFELLRPYDLTKYRTRIEKRFRGEKLPKIDELVARAFGKKPARRKTPPPFDPRRGYRIDAYADAVVRAATRAALADSVPQPVTAVWLAGDQGDIQVSRLIVASPDTQHEIAFRRPATRLPHRIEDDDGLMNELCERHGIALDDEDAPAWGNYLKLPHALLVAELADAAERVAGELRKARKRFAGEHRSGVSYHDANWEGGLEDQIRRELEGLTEGQRVDFAAMCFASAKRRARLLGG